MTDLQLQGSSTVAWTDGPSGAETLQVVLGRDDAGAGAIQIGLASIASRPTKGVLDDLWKSRGTKAPMGFIVAASAPEGVWLHYPSAGTPPIGPVTVGQAERQLQSVLDEPDGLAAHARIRAIQEAFSSAGAAGFSNHFLFATYHLNRDVPRRPDWEDAVRRADAVLPLRGVDLITALGFSAEAAGNDRLLVLRTTTGPRRAVAVLLRDEEHFDQRAAAYQLTPVAKALEVAGREDVPWVIALRKSTLRLYPGRDGIGVGQRGQSETYFELDLDLLAPELAGLLTLIFSAGALDAGGSAQQILDGSGKYAADLGTRLRDRVYEGVVPRIALAIAERLPALGLAVDSHGLQVAYRLTMRILFRLLFQAYGEAAELLPAGRNDHYDANSLQAFINREIGTGADQFSGESTAIWSDLAQVWGVIFTGNERWEVPAYGGSLFDPSTDEGALLKRLELPDSVIGPALQELLSEETVDQAWGPVDFRSLQVREFGTIYEGLLESSLSLAEQNLTVDRNGSYVPANDGDEVVAAAASAYFHSASGDRKATGSYYTPKVIVDHLIDRSVAPALEAHLGRIKALIDEGKDRAASEAFFDFRVADLAMGSAHFLVAAVDKIERGMRDFLTANEVPGVRAELARLAEKARDALGQDVDGAKAITDGQLLRRQVARRCIYGLDINPLAVELSQLALWIHTFVPGLPMSSLDHGLVLANSLTGIGTIDEAMEALNADGLFEQIIREPLMAARELLADYANASEADKSEVATGAQMLAKAREAAAPAKAIFDVAVARRLGVAIDEAWDAKQFTALAGKREVREAVDPLRPAHLPFLFPEVFLRVRPGFDALVGNPPWEAPYIKADRWWNLRFPGVILLDDDAKEERISLLRAQQPDLAAALTAEVEVQDRIRTALLKRGWPGLGSGHVDLYQAFAWKNWDAVREDGRFGLVLPRGAQSGSGLERWRRLVASAGTFASVCLIENVGRWAFDMEPRYTVGLMVVVRSRGTEVRFAGPFTSEASFRRGASKLSSVPIDEFLSWTDTAAFLAIPEERSVDVFRAMKRHRPFGVGGPGWRLRPTRGDLLSWKSIARSTEHPVLLRSGRSFNIWAVDAGPARAGLDARDFRRAYLGYLASAGRNRRSVHFGRDYDLSSLPIDRARIAVRWISRATDSRTCIVALLPPGCATDDSASVMHLLQGGPRDEAFVLGVLASIPFDWQARLLTEMNFTFEVLNSMGVPAKDQSGVLARRVVNIAGRLAAVDGRFETWAAEVGVEVGTANAEPTKSELIAELDALVSILYGLTREQVEHIFATFHRGWDYADRLERVLGYFEQWTD
ncbi:hypothetical protein D8Y24_03200 [Agrococcus lahaulensis]|nr:hypothetical protein D8Y24_03200 [Agrococcus lahaulensis]